MINYNLDSHLCIESSETELIFQASDENDITRKCHEKFECHIHKVCHVRSNWQQENFQVIVGKFVKKHLKLIWQS